MAFTYFFRDLQTLNTAVKYLVPFSSGASKVRVWDAGCAMGQEPYSLAILLAEAMNHFAYRNLKIYATDIDGSNLFRDIIAGGTYPTEELERIPRELFDKYFISAAKHGHHQIVDQVRSRLEFQRQDLLQLQPPATEIFLVLCKNVLLHFQPHERVEVMKMFHRALVPGGFFATEQTQKLPPELEPYFEQVSPDCQMFRKIGGPI
jgi:chemotaxis protein methyltransferase CheR